jgi:UDP-N-acetylmuramoylalanine--D-glutamate ligase
LSVSSGPGAQASFGTVLLAGLGVTNTAAARALSRRGHEVVLVDDGPPAAGEALAAELGCEFLHAPDREGLGAAMRRADVILPAPGLPESHAVFALAAAAGAPVVSEFDLAGAWDDRPLLAVTGTNGKTTVTSMVAAMLEASGVPTAAVGNLEVPLVAAIDDPAPRCFVVEASSFRLGHSRHFRPRVGTWLNFAADHLDVHRDLDTYRRAKARIWAEQAEGDTAVVNADDPVVAAAAPAPPVRVWRFGLGDDTGLEFRQVGDRLVGPDRVDLAAVGSLWRRLPHDRSNALAAAATALAGGATPEGVRAALGAFGGLPHRVELVGETGGVRWYDDSKATAPHATLAAAEGFARVVLIAGGRNKGLDLSALAGAASVVAVVGIGEAADEVVGAFPGIPSSTAASMGEAVDAAARLAGPGDVVLLSPGCASFDWYGSYAERGDDFAAEVRRLVGAAAEGRR